MLLYRESQLELCGLQTHQVQKAKERGKKTGFVHPGYRPAGGCNGMRADCFQHAVLPTDHARLQVAVILIWMKVDMSTPLGPINPEGSSDG
eukprot:1547510-Rhodomonas_salina.2